MIDRLFLDTKLDQLRKAAANNRKSSARRNSEMSECWWDGYLQAITDVTHVVDTADD